jgi:hypothetical protein
MLINKQDILNSEVYTYPWEHQIIDNIIDQTSFNRIRTICSHLVDINNVKKYPLLTKKMKQACLGSWNCSQTFHLYDLINSGVSEDLVELIYDISQEFLNLLTQIHSRYSNFRSFESYQVVPNINMDFSGLPRDVHYDAPRKSISIVVYLDPDDNEATSLHLDNTSESIVKTPEWKLNRGLIFCPEKNKTWHSYRVKESKKVRFTLVIFIENSNANSKMIEYKFSNGKVVRFPDADFDYIKVPYNVQMEKNFNVPLSKIDNILDYSEIEE